MVVGTSDRITKPATVWIGASALIWLTMMNGMRSS
jgi:hypothetical protein